MVEAIAEKSRKPAGRHFRMLLGPPLLWVVLWLVGGLIINASWTWFYNEFWILGGLASDAHALWGLWLAGWFLFRLLQTRDRLFAKPLFAMLVLWPALAVLSFTSFLSDVGDRVAFMLKRTAFDQIVADASTGALSAANSKGQRDGVRFSFSESQPGLIAFPWLNGIPDGGSAVVYDATDAVGRIRHKGAEPVVADLRDLLRGHPIICERFADPHYFMCHFS